MTIRIDLVARIIGMVLLIVSAVLYEASIRIEGNSNALGFLLAGSLVPPLILLLCYAKLYRGDFARAIIHLATLIMLSVSLWLYANASEHASCMSNLGYLVKTFWLFVLALATAIGAAIANAMSRRIDSA